MERQSKGSRDLEAYRRRGQGPSRAVAPFKEKILKIQVYFSIFHYTKPKINPITCYYKDINPTKL
jgi:hypothetical protein